MRWTNVYQRELRQRRRLRLSSTAQFTRSTLNSTSVLEGNAFASFLLGAPSSGEVDVNAAPHYQWFFVAPVDPGRLARQQQADAEPRLPLGLQRRGRGRGQPAELRVRSDDRQPGVGARRSAGDGRPALRRRRRRPDDAVEVRQEQLPVPRRHGLLRSTRRPCCAPATASTSSTRPARSFNNGFSLATPIIASNDGNRTPTYALANPWPNGIQDAARQLAGPADVPRPRSRLLEPGLRRAERAPVLGRHPARAAVARSRSRRPTPAAAATTSKANWGGFNEPSADVPARSATSRWAAAAAFCDQLLPNPFFGVPGFEGTTRFTNPTLSRFELARPFPAFTGFNMNEQNDGKM